MSPAAAQTVWSRMEADVAPSFFTSWTWAGSWLEALPPSIRPLLLTASLGLRVIGAAFVVARKQHRLVRSVRQLYFNATGSAEVDRITIEHNGFMAQPETDALLWPAFLRWFATQQEFDELIVPGLRQTAIQQQLVPGSLLCHEIISPAYARSLPFAGGREALLTGFRSNARQQLRRNLRAAERLGPLLCERADSAETAAAWFEALKRFHVQWWTRRGTPNAFAPPFFETFHRLVIARGVSEGSVDVLRISAGGAPLGYLYNFRGGDSAIAYQSGFDDTWSDLRPGYISHLLAMEFTARRGISCYDFLAGDNQLKRTFANETYGISSLRFTRRSFGANFERVARFTFSKVRNLSKIKEPAQRAGS